MRIDESLVLTTSNGKAWMGGVLHSLAACHTAGVCHCDIRWCNVMQFGANGGIQLIDHDCAVNIGDSVRFAGGGQYDMRPYSLRHHRLNSVVTKRTTEMDKEMVMLNGPTT
jgi:serine/threonine protein kinase